MKINTFFNTGETVYGVQKVYPTDRWEIIGPLIIGQIRVTLTDSPGLPDEKTFDNYKAKKEYTEEYMCVETGIGSGQVYPMERLFKYKEEAQAIVVGRNTKNKVPF